MEVTVMQQGHENLGDIIKTARQSAGITVEKLAEQVDRSERYIYLIENEGQKPSYDVLYKLIRILAIAPDRIFYPERSRADTEMECLIRQLYCCDEQSLEIAKSVISTLLKTYNNK